MDKNIIKKTFLIVPFLLLPSARNIWKHFESPWVMTGLYAAFLTTFVASILFLNGKNQLMRKLLNSRYLLLVLGGAATAAGYILYARFDGLGWGSTSDDAFMLPIQSFFSGNNLYVVKLFDGAPISPGPGWLILNALFGFSALHPFLTFLYVVSSTYLFSLCNRDFNLPLLFCMTSTIFWSLVGSGSDLVAVGFSLVLCIFLVENYLKNNISVVWLALLIGSISTARIIFTPLPVLIGLLFLKRDMGLSIRFMFASFSINIAWHFAFYMLSDWYQPFHLFDRGIGRVGYDLILIGSIGVVVLAGIVIQSCENNFVSRLRWFSFILTLVLGLVAFGELRSVHFDAASWEGASYLFVALPSVMFAICAKGDIESNSPILNASLASRRTINSAHAKIH